MLYNHFVVDRQQAYKDREDLLSLNTKGCPSSKRIVRRSSKMHSQVLQNVAVRVDLAFQSFYRRCQQGGKPGYPFKGLGRYDPHLSPSIALRDNYLRLGKIGCLCQATSPLGRGAQTSRCAAVLPASGMLRWCVKWTPARCPKAMSKGP